MFNHQELVSLPNRAKPRRPAARWLILALLTWGPGAQGVTVPKDVTDVAERGIGRQPTGFATHELRVEPTLDIYLPGAEDFPHEERMAEFLAEHSDAWEVRWDVRSDRPHLIQGPGVPLLPGRGNSLRSEDLELGFGAELSLSDVERLLRRKLRQWEKVLGIQESDLVLDMERSVSYGPRKHLWSIEFQQVYRGVPVEARVFFRINHGNIVQFGTDQVADIRMDPTPRLSRERAVKGLRKRLGLRPDRVQWSDRGTLKILPTRESSEGPGQRFSESAGQGYGHRLVWEMLYFDPDVERAYRVLVDAHTGRLLEHLDLIRYANLSGEAFGVDNTQPKVEVPFAHGIVSLLRDGDVSFPRTDGRWEL